VLAHPDSPRQIQEGRKMVVCVCVFTCIEWMKFKSNAKCINVYTCSLIVYCKVNICSRWSPQFCFVRGSTEFCYVWSSLAIQLKVKHSCFVVRSLATRHCTGLQPKDIWRSSTCCWVVDAPLIMQMMWVNKFSHFVNKIATIQLTIEVWSAGYPSIDFTLLYSLR